MKKEGQRYSPAKRLMQVRALLNSPGGVTVYDVAERLDVNVRTAIRYLQALLAAGEPLDEETRDRRKFWRLRAGSRKDSITLSTSQMMALFLARRVFDFLDGTGFKDDLDDVFARLETSLSRRTFVAARNLDRKIFDVNEAPHVYAGRLEHVDDIVTALINEDRLRVRHESVARGTKRFVVEPYTLLIYKKGLYLVAHSRHHQALRTFALDGFRFIKWLKGDRFEYPPNYDPATVAKGNFGLIGGHPEHVRVRFDDKVERFVRRRQWHPTQQIRAVPGGVELTMQVAPSVEVASWVLGFGEMAEVLAPASLRHRVGGELQRAARRYGIRQ